MTINVKHFDSLTRQDLEITENIKNSLAEYLFPDAEFAIASIYQDITTPDHLDTYQDKKLQFASGEVCLEVLPGHGSPQWCAFLGPI